MPGVESCNGVEDRPRVIGLKVDFAGGRVVVKRGDQVAERAVVGRESFEDEERGDDA